LKAKVVLLVVILMSFGLSRSRGGDVAESGFLDRTETVAGERVRYQVYVPAGPAPEGGWPVILFLHGSGERGRDGLLPTEVGIGTAIRRDRSRFPCLVVFPQCFPGERWFGEMEKAALEALDRTLEGFPSDPDRVSVTGISMGGAGAWYLAARHPSRFRAVAPVCARVGPPPGERIPPEAEELIGPEDRYASIARRIGCTPVWVFHGDADPVVPVEESRKMVEALGEAGCPARYTEYPGVGHDSWNRAYAEPGFVEWLLSQ